MIVTLIETYRIFNMTLPDKVKGRFWITDVDSFGNDRKLISVEADEESWVLKGSDSAVICDTHNRIADDTVLEDNVFYNVRILEENEEGYVYAQPDDIGRQTFDKYVFRDNAELTIGRDSDNTVYFNSGLEKLPESQAELGGPDRGTSVWTEDAGNIDIFGVGIIMGKSTKEDVEAYFGKPLYEKDTENGMVIQYAYKNVYLNFNFYKDTGKIRVILIDGVKGLDDV